MPVEQALAEDHPMMLAWNSYKLTEEFENTKRWAVSKDHTEGALWAAFVAGHTAALATSATLDAMEAEVRRLTEENELLRGVRTALRTRIKRAIHIAKEEDQDAGSRLYRYVGAELAAALAATEKRGT